MAHILLVDDEQAVRESLASRIGAMGHTCVEASDGLHALARLHEREFDLVLTDVMMPRMNGFQLMERVLPFLEGRVPIVILSSVGDQGGIRAALAAGAYDYLNKPASPHDVERVISGGLERRKEMVRLLGRRRGRGGPVPQSALGPAPNDLTEAPLDQSPAGVPAVRETSVFVSVPPPDSLQDGAGRGRGPSLLTRLVRRLRGRAA